jgi:hypothetical protein
MTPFIRRDSLADTAAQNLSKIRNATLVDELAESTYNTNHRGALEEFPSLFYIEKPEHVQAVNAFMKRFLMGTFANPTHRIMELNAQLNTIGLSIQNYDGESGTYNVFQYGTGASDHPVTGEYVVDDEVFLRSKVHIMISIRKTAVPGGLYSVDAELYATKKK